MIFKKKAQLWVITASMRHLNSEVAKVVTLFVVDVPAWYREKSKEYYIIIQFTTRIC